MSEDFLAALAFCLLSMAVALYALRQWGKLQDERIRLMKRVWELEGHEPGKE